MERPPRGGAFTLIELLVVIAIIQDKPATYHNGQCSLSFADGHTKTRRWTGSLADRDWLKERTTELQ